MLRKIVICFAVFMVSMIASEEFDFSSDYESFESGQQEINGDLMIFSTHNTNNEVPHPAIQFEKLSALRNVSGIMHYGIGARVNRKFFPFYFQKL